MFNRYKKAKIHRHKNTRKQYYKRFRYPRIGFNRNDIIIITQIGARLDKLANHFYNDSTLWWVIASANPENLRKDSVFVKPGLTIRIPTNVEAIKEEFDLLNR